MTDIQALLDAISESGRRERSNYHVTLGRLIEELEKLNNEGWDRPVVFAHGGSPRSPHSYRGYYSDLSFESGGEIMAKELAAICRDALGRTFEGYKGGDYVMSKETPLWAAPYGCCGLAIVSIIVTADKVILGTKEVD